MRYETKRSVKRFNAAEDEFIRRHSEAISAAAIARQLDRHQASVISRQITMGLRTPNRKIKAFSAAEDQRIVASAGNVNLHDLAAEFGRNAGSVYGRAKRLGLRFDPVLRKADKQLRGGYWWVPYVVDGKRRWIQEHRYVMAAAIGRPLTPQEQVHHIDFDKKNNALDNLYLCANKQGHRAVHNRLEKMLGSASVIQRLLADGHLTFDKTTGRYAFVGGA